MGYHPISSPPTTSAAYELSQCEAAGSESIWYISLCKALGDRVGGFDGLNRWLGLGCGFIGLACFIRIDVFKYWIDGSEIRRSPVDMVNIWLLTGFYTSQVVQDFVHQQYVCIYI